MKRTGSIGSRVGPAVTTNLTRSDCPGGRGETPRGTRSHPLSTNARHLRIRTPAFLTTFIGREKLVDEIERVFIAQADCRLLTLTGAGGTGKTRAALHAARTVADR